MKLHKVHKGGISDEVKELHCTHIDSRYQKVEHVGEKYMPTLADED